MYMLNAVLTRPVSMTATLAMLTPHSLFLPGAFLLQTCNGASGGGLETLTLRGQSLAFNRVKRLQSSIKSKDFKEVNVLHVDKEQGSKVAIVTPKKNRDGKVQKGKMYVRKSITVEGKVEDGLSEKTLKEIMVYLTLDGPIKIREYYREKVKNKVMEHFIMDLCEGPTLGAHDTMDLFQKAFGDHEDQRKLKNYVRKLLLRLDEFHKKGYIHMDLKPGNIMHLQNPDDINDMEPILIDFEQAQQVPDGEKTLIKAQFGSPGFQAPEVVQLGEVRLSPTEIVIGAKTDVYSIGCIILKLLGRNTIKRGLKLLMGNDMIGGYEERYQTMDAEDILKKLEKRNLKKYGDDFIGFMQRLLAIDYNERADIEELLDHAWLEKKDERRRLANRLCGAELF